MKSYIWHYYDWADLLDKDEKIATSLFRSAVVVDEETGKKKVDFDTELFRQEGDFIISNEENRLQFCLSVDEVVRVPEGVKSIGAFAFHEDFMPNAKHIILSSTVDGISPYAITSHTVEELTVNNLYIFISEDAFVKCPSLRLIHHVPGGVTARLEKD